VRTSATPAASARCVPVELIIPDLRSALALAVERRIYAYDAYCLACALKSGCPLLTLDRAMQGHARELNIRLLETP
jgi:predicted nucleic acid-binding protein